MRFFKPRNLLLVTALGLAVVLLVIIALQYRPENQLKAVVKALPQGVDVSLQDIDYTHIDQGRSRWRLAAQQVERQANSGLLGVDSPQMSFYDAQGGTTGSLQAAKGEVSDDYQQISLRGDVVLKNASGYTLYTDRLDYDQTTQTATTDAHVRLVADGLQLEGIGLVYYAQQERLLLKSHVRGLLDSARMK